MSQIPKKILERFKSGELIPAIAQNDSDNLVLMLAYMNEESYQLTLETKTMHYWSRSRQKLWKKGESSGHTQKILRWFVDCDRDTLLFEVEQEGGACHTGFASCFYTPLDGQGNDLPPEEKPLFMDFLFKASQDKIFAEGGGLLIRGKDGELLGAVGVTGDKEMKDEELAAHGIRAAGLKTDEDCAGSAHHVRLAN